MEIDPRLQVCLPYRLHPVSRHFLERWLAGTLSTPLFRRFFHLPNSTYLSVGECLVSIRDEVDRDRGPGLTT